MALPLPAVALPMVGAPGSPDGVMLFEAFDAAPSPAAFVALTVNVTAAPLTSPFTVTVLQGALQVPVMLPGVDEAV